MFVKNHNDKVLKCNAHGVILKLNPGLNLIENPLFTKKELKEYFRDQISFIDEIETPKVVKESKTETKKEVKTPEVKTPEVKTEVKKETKKASQKGKRGSAKGTKSSKTNK